MENQKKQASVEPWMCGECRHMHPYGSYKSAQVDDWLMRGECRRFPPHPLVLDPAAKVDADVPFDLHAADEGYRIVHVWPVVDAMSSCGEFSAEKAIAKAR